MADFKDLLPVTEAQYGDQYRTDFMTLFRDYVDSAQKISDRRHQANTFFSTINTIMVAATGLIPEKVTDLASTPQYNWQIALAGLILCVVWRQMIMAYRDLNAAKFTVINELERHLPMAAYKVEWQHKSAAESSSLTSVESWVPGLFMLLYVFVFFIDTVFKS